MTWAKFDDRTPGNRKIARLSDAAFRLWFNLICYSNEHRLGGVLTYRDMRMQISLWDDGPALVEELLSVPPGYAVGNLERVEGGFRIHDYGQYQPSPDELEAQRQRIAAARSAAGRRGAASRWGAREDASSPPADSKNGKADDDLPSGPAWQNGKRHGNGDSPVPGPGLVSPETKLPSPDPAAEEIARTVLGVFAEEPTPARVDAFARLLRRRELLPIWAREELDPGQFEYQAVLCREHHQTRHPGRQEVWLTRYKNWLELAVRDYTDPIVPPAGVEPPAAPSGEPGEPAGDPPPVEPADDAWRTIRERLLVDAQLARWFAPVDGALVGGTLTLVCPDAYYRDWIETRLCQVVRAAAAAAGYKAVERVAVTILVPHG